MIKQYGLKFLLIASMVLGISLNANATEFIFGLEDIPLADGFEQGENISFGNEASRFVETKITKEDGNFEELKDFYIDTLPQLGWSIQENKENSVSFTREDEEVEIATEKDKPFEARITVKSKGI